MLTVHTIKKITKALSVSGNLSAVTKGVSINSRTIEAGQLFIAIKGANFDGHDFIKDAVQKGAVAVVVSKQIQCPDNIAVIRVDDTTKALGLIAAWHRRQFKIPVVAITGSAGKTTTKEMVAHVLGRKYNVLKNIGTENNQFGVPLTLLKLDASHEIAVLELGTNRPGDISWLARITCPTITIFTNIGESHLERLKTRSGVFREKSQLVKFMDPQGTIIFNNDDAYLPGLLKKRGQQTIIRFSCYNKAEYQAADIRVENNQRLRFTVKGWKFSLNTPAAHNIYNALSAISCGLASKIRYNDIITALNRFKFQGGRQEVRKVGRFWLINDTYNANPVSFKSAVHTLDAMHIRGKKIIVCGDMLELGVRSKALHETVGKVIAGSTVKNVLAVGEKAKFITQTVNRLNPRLSALHCPDLGEIQRQLADICRPGDAVLVKGSRGMHMERVVEYLEKLFK